MSRESPAAPPVGTPRRLWHTVLTGVSQAVSFLGVAALGLVIAAQYGSTAVTDGFFVAQSVYGIALLMGQSLRTTAVAELTRRPSESRGETFGAVGLLSLLAGVAFAAVAFGAVPVLLADLPPAAREMAQLSLAVLWPAAALQLIAGALAAMLATRDRVSTAAGAYSAGAVLGLAAFVPLRSLVGDVALPLVLVVSSLSTAGLLWLAVVRSGGVGAARPTAAAANQRAGHLLVGAVALMIGQLVVAIAVGISGRIEEQAATTLAYGMMAINLVAATAVTPAMVMLAPVLANTWTGDRAVLGDLAVRVFRFGAVLVVPVVAVVALVGGPVLELLMPPAARQTVPDIVAVIVVLSPTVLATLMVLIPELGLITQGRFARLAATVAVAIPFQLVAATAVVAAGGGVRALAAVTAASAVLSATLVTLVAAGPARASVFAGVGRAIVQLVVVPAACFALAGLALGSGLGGGAAAWLIGALLSGCWLLVTRREELRGWLQMVRPAGASAAE